MIIKNISQFLFIAAISIINISAMEIPSSDTDNNNIEKKHTTMVESPEYQQYQNAKIAHQKYNTDDTLYMVNLCKTELQNTKECLNWLHAIERGNIAQSNKWPNTQKNHYHSSLSTEQKSAKLDNNNTAAWRVVTETPEYKLFKKAKIAHEMHNTEDTKLLLEQCRAHAKETPQYQQYFSTLQPKKPAKEDIYSAELPTKNTNPNICLHFTNKKIKPGQKPIEITFKEKSSTVKDGNLP